MPREAKFTKRTKDVRNFSFKAKPILQQQIGDLCKKWGETVTQVISRVIQSAWEKEFGEKKEP